jgi:hypothetical protein
VSRNPGRNGDHEVHSAVCERLPIKEHRIYLGDYSGGWQSLRVAWEYYPRAIACTLCTPASPDKPE